MSAVGGDRGGGSPGEQGVGGARETGVERVGSRISTMVGSRKEIKKASFHFVTAYHPVKETNPTTFLDFHLTSPRLKAKFYMLKDKKRKFVLRIKKKKSNTSVKIGIQFLCSDMNHSLKLVFL